MITFVSSFAADRRPDEIRVAVLTRNAKRVFTSTARACATACAQIPDAYNTSADVRQCHDYLPVCLVRGNVRHSEEYPRLVDTATAT